MLWTDFYINCAIEKALDFLQKVQIGPVLKGTADEPGYVAKKIDEWLFSVGCNEKLTDLGFTAEDPDVGRICQEHSVTETFEIRTWVQLLHGARAAGV